METEHRITTEVGLDFGKPLLGKRIMWETEKSRWLLMFSFPGKHCPVSLRESRRHISDHKGSVDLRTFVWQNLVCHIRVKMVIFHRFQPSVSQDMPQVRSSISSRMFPGGEGTINPTKFLRILF